MRVLLAVAAVAALAGAPVASPAPAACSAAAAKAAILASPSLRSLRPIVLNGGGVDKLICSDFTRDGQADMAATVFSGGTAGDIAWVVFRRSHGSWVLALRELDRYKLGLFRVGGDLVESQPVYRKNDPNCCPTGGFDHRSFRWNGRALAVTRRWHDRSARS